MASSSVENIVEAVEEEEDWANLLPSPEGYETPVDFDMLNESFRRVDPPAWIETFRALEMKIVYAHQNFRLYVLATIVTAILTVVFILLTLLVIFKHMPGHYTVTCVTLLVIFILFFMVFLIKCCRVYGLREYCMEYAMAVVPPGQDEFVMRQGLKERFDEGWLTTDRSILRLMRMVARDFFRVRVERFNPEATEVQRTLRSPLDRRY